MADRLNIRDMTLPELMEWMNKVANKIQQEHWPIEDIPALLWVLGALGSDQPAVQALLMGFNVGFVLRGMVEREEVVL